MKNNKGATLVEVMMAILVFMVGIEALLAVYTQSMQMGKRADYAYTAYNLAKNHLERLRVLNYALLPSAVETSTTINNDGDPDSSGSFLRTTAVTSSYGGNALLTQVTVQVNYVFRGTQSASPMELTAIILNQ